MHKRVLYIDTDTTFTAYLMAGLILKGQEASLDTENAGSVSLSGCAETTNGSIPTGKDGSDGNNKIKDKRLVQVFLPSEGRFESLLGDAIASMEDASIVILDSLNSFYNMYPTSYLDSGPTRQSLRKKSETQKNDISLTTALASHPSIKEVSNKEKPKKSPYTLNRLNHLLSVFIMLLVKHGVYFNIPILVTTMVRYKKVSEDLWVKSPTCRRLLHQQSVVRLSVEMSGEKDLSVNIMKHPSISQQTIVYPNAGISLSPQVNQNKIIR